VVVKVDCDEDDCCNGFKQREYYYFQKTLFYRVKKHCYQTLNSLKIAWMLICNWLTRGGIANNPVQIEA
jgi:hypothetical protein